MGGSNVPAVLPQFEVPGNKKNVQRTRGLYRSAPPRPSVRWMCNSVGAFPSSILIVKPCRDERVRPSEACGVPRLPAEQDQMRLGPRPAKMQALPAARTRVHSPRCPRREAEGHQEASRPLLRRHLGGPRECVRVLTCREQQEGRDRQGPVPGRAGCQAVWV